MSSACRPPPSPPPSRIPADIADAPTQRLYLASLFLLLQAYKVSHAVYPQPLPPTELNLPLVQWVAADLAALSFIWWLKVPRLDWGWKARWAVRAVLVASDWLLFGRWTFAVAFLLPGFIKNLLVRSLSTTESSVRLSSVYGSDKAHLGGQYTVHILAVSTAFLNPLSTIYCRHTSSSKSDPTLIPLVFNNTAPSKLTYSLTTFDDPPVTSQHTISASALVRHPSHHHHLQSGRRDSISNAEDDDLALANEWSLVPASSTNSPRGKQQQQQVVWHRIPDSSSSSPASPADPFNLFPTESLYYLPITALGAVQLDSIVDTDGHPIRIRRKRAASSPSLPPSSSSSSGAEFEHTRILRCPTAGFLLAPGQSQEEHRCLSPSAARGEAAALLSGADLSQFPLGLVVSGQAQPLKLRWHAREGDEQRGAKKSESLEGIVAPLDEEGRQQSEEIRVPFNVSLIKPGRTTFYLDAVTDGVGNEVAYFGSSSSSQSSHSSSTTSTHAPLVPGSIASRSVVVHPPPSVAFTGECASKSGKGEDLPLLVGKSRTLHFSVTGAEQGEKTEVEVRFEPAEGSDAKGWTRRIEVQGSKGTIVAKEPGSYEIMDVKSRWCGGAVLVPNVCSLALQPFPTLTPTFSPLTDQCSSEIGLLSTLHLTGAPPFVVHYSVSRSSSSRASSKKTYSKRISHSRDEIRLEAPGPGEWEYRFLRIEDKFYGEGVVLKGEEYVKRQTVHERGDARWRNAEKGKTVHSCEGETVQVELELSGTAPWNVDYSVVGQPPQSLTGITSSPYLLEVSIPPQIAKHGGQFALSLESVQDGNGCKRPLATSDLVVEVKRTKPTARFHGREGKRSVVLKEGEAAQIPLRLTGEGPWTVTYQPPSRDGTPLAPVTFRASQANVDINIERALPGSYTLLSVRDRFCPGDVFETDWSVGTLPRPSLKLGDKIGKVGRNGSVVRKGVCANAVDSIPVYFSGQAPYRASYTLTKGSSGEKREHTLQAIQSRADLTLFTAAPGHHVYHFTGVGDSLYTTPEPKGLTAPQGGKNGLLRIEQDVFALPAAYFAHGAKHGFCINDELASRGSNDLIVHLTGEAPFELEFEVREDGGSRAAPKRFTVPAVAEHKWPVSLPVGLTKASPHSISIRRVKDAHGCETILDSLPAAAPPPSSDSASSAVVPSGAGQRTSVTLAVAEIATIAPVSPQVDHCVGDFLDFVVVGSPPFTVKYEFEGKEHKVPLTSGKFQRVAAKPGTFRVVSVGHGEDQCRSNEVDIVKHIHPLPSARVTTGDSFVIDLREGEQTEIAFLFEGTPPFSFTYSRRAPQDRSKDRTVLETHTVTGIQEHQYSIFTSQEGTWSISYVADAYCSFPPAQKSAVVKA
ncbi:hypothetical protein JCM8547_003780 [Rhodosporidiobolus lusitaniae]